MKLYNFSRLISKYSVAFTLHRETGGFDGGKWVGSSPAVTEMRGAIVPLAERKVYGSGGVYTTQDRELYLSEPLEAPLSSLRVIYKGNTYAVEEERNFEDYGDVAVYTLKWQSKKAVEWHE